MSREAIELMLKCTYCLNKLNLPKLLPCGWNICKDCLENLKKQNKNFIDCFYCKSKHFLSLTEEFPTQKILTDVIYMIPVKVERGDEYEKSIEYIECIKSCIDEYKNKSADEINVIKSYFQTIKNDIIDEREFIMFNLNSVRNVVDFEKADLMIDMFISDNILNEIEQYEIKCLKHHSDIETNSIRSGFIKQKDDIRRLFEDACVKVTKWQERINKIDVTESCLKEIHEKSKALKLVLENTKVFYESLLFLGRLPVYVSINESLKDKLNNRRNRKYLRYKEFCYSDILNIERLEQRPEKLRAVLNKKIQYGSVLSGNNLNVQSIWLSLYKDEKLVLCLSTLNTATTKQELTIKLMDFNGTLINENKDNSNCDLTTMCSFDEYILFSIHDLDKDIYQLQLFDLNMNLTLFKCVTLNYKPRYIYKTQLYLYVVSAVNRSSTTSPISDSDKSFVHVHDVNLNELFRFGQCTDHTKPFYMSPNLLQLYVDLCNDKLFCRDDDNCYLKLYELSSGMLIKQININLLDCLLHVDSIGRIIVLNQDNKILYVFNDDSKILFEYDLTYIPTISSFCITNNGHLLINDSENKVIYTC